MIFVRSYATWATLACALGLVGLFQFCDWDKIAEALRVVATAYMLMMMVAWAPTAVSGYTTRGWPDREQWGGLANFTLAACGAVAGLVSLFYRLSGRPAWIIDAPLINAQSFGLILWAAVYTTAPSFFGREVRIRTRWSIAGLWLASMLLIAFLVLSPPDLSPMARWLERTFDLGTEAP